MNAAFAIGRICDMESGRRQMLMLKKSDYMVRCFLKFIDNFAIIFMQFSQTANNSNKLLWG